MSDELEKFQQENRMEIPESRVKPQDSFNIDPSIELNKKGPPAYSIPCGTCGEVHEPGKIPACICIKCKEFSRIVWCGYCLVCAWKEYADRFSPEVANTVFPDYAKWLKWKAKKAREEGFEWERG